MKGDAAGGWEAAVDANKIASMQLIPLKILRVNFVNKSKRLTHPSGRRSIKQLVSPI